MVQIQKSEVDTLAKTQKSNIINMIIFIHKEGM